MQSAPRPALLLLFALLVAASSLRAWAQSSPPAFTDLPTAAITIHTGDGNAQRFTAWVAESSAQRSRGLMFVEALPPAHGMLFLYEPPRTVRMWMKNTLIPLDMLFVDASGRIVHIHRRARPGSERIIEAPSASAAVLELAGGAAEAIQAGDRLEWEWLPPDTP